MVPTTTDRDCVVCVVEDIESVVCVLCGTTGIVVYRGII